MELRNKICYNESEKELLRWFGFKYIRLRNITQITSVKLRYHIINKQNRKLILLYYFQFIIYKLLNLNSAIFIFNYSFLMKPFPNYKMYRCLTHSKEVK